MLLKALIGVVLCIIALTNDAAATEQQLIPAGYYVWCENNPASCEDVEPVKVPLKEAILAPIETVNRLVNQYIIAQIEDPGMDVWQLNPNTGDCEDYVLTKRWYLINDVGFPPGAFVLVLVKTEHVIPEWHLVLGIRTDSPYADGIIMLDNRTNEIGYLADSKYEIVSFLN